MTELEDGHSEREFRASPMPPHLDRLIYDEDRSRGVDDVIDLMSMIVPHHTFRKIIGRTRQVHELFNRKPGAEAKHLLILGRSGSGKSRALKHYAAGFPPRRGQGGWVRPVVYVKVPSDSNRTSLLKEMLRALGVPSSGKQDLKDMENSIRHHLVEQVVELLVVDEFQHLVDQKTKRFQSVTADFFKDLLSDNICQMVFCGLESSIAASEINVQLGRRKRGRYDVLPYNWLSVEGNRNYRGFLSAVAKWMADRKMFDDRPSLEGKEIAQRLHVATDGLIGLTMNLVIVGATIALRDQAATLGLKHLGEAFDELKREGISKNPFTEKECPKALGVSVDYVFDEKTNLRKLVERLPLASFVR